MAINFGLGAQDWLKMAGSTTKPIGTSPPTTGAWKPPTPPPVNTTTPTVPKTGSGTTAPVPIPGPVNNGTNSTFKNPFTVTNSAFNVAPPKIDPVSGLPIQPAGTPKTNVSTTPQAVNVQYEPPSTQVETTTPQPLATGVETAPPPDTQVMTALPTQPITIPNTAAPVDQNVTPPATETAPQPVQPPEVAPAPPVAGPNPITATPAYSTTAPETDAANVVNAPVQPTATTPVKTEPSLDDNLAQYEKIAMDWANGIVDDKVFRTTANRAILSMGLNNNAEMDALQMRINADPALRGQGAGSALLSMMAANHGFSADQMFGQLAQSAQEKILDMQKYGLTQGVAINRERRANDYTKLNMLIDAGDFVGASQLAAKIADFPGANISPTGFSMARSRLTEDANALMTSGNYVGAAEKISALTGQPVDATELQSRDPALWTKAQAMVEAGDYEGASKLFAKLGVSVAANTLMQNNEGNRARMMEDIQTLLASGNFEAAAKKISAMTGETVDATQLQARDAATWTQAQALEDKGDYEGASKLYAKLGVSVSPTTLMQNNNGNRDRMSEDIQTLLAAGNYKGAAEKMAMLTGKEVDPASLEGRDPKQWEIAQALEKKGDFEGAAAAYKRLGLDITPDDLRAQDPFQQATWTNTLDAIKAQATTNPALATAQLQALMNNPAAAKYLGFTSDTNAAELINSIVTGQYQADQQMRSGLQAEINLKAKSAVSFSQALVDYKAMGPLAWQGMTQSGKKMASADLGGFNTARQSLGMGDVHKDAQGNIVDAQGNALTDEDFAETAAAADYKSRMDKMKTQPWESAYENLMAPNSAFREKILSLPGGEQAVKEALQMTYLGGGYKMDEATGTLVPDYAGGMPWDNPNTAHLFHNWPLAQFNADGSLNGTYDLGGETYGDKLGDSVVQKLPDDEALDSAYAKYRYNNGTLSASEWYFATAGGTKKEDKTRIPTELVKEDLTNPGTTTGTTTGTGTTGTTGTDTTPTPVDTNPFATLVNSRLQMGDPAKAESLIESSRVMNEYYKDKPLNEVTRLGEGSDKDLQAAVDALKAKGLDDEALGKIVSHKSNKGTLDDIFNTDKSGYSVWKGTPAFAYYAVYTRMMKDGLAQSDAYQALKNLVGEEKANGALMLEQLAGGSGNTLTLYR